MYIYYNECTIHELTISFCWRRAIQEVDHSLLRILAIKSIRSKRFHIRLLEFIFPPLEQFIMNFDCTKEIVKLSSIVFFHEMIFTNTITSPKRKQIHRTRRVQPLNPKKNIIYKH